MDKDQFTCESIIRALKSGLVPARGIERIAVGRDAEIQQIQRDLAFAKNGGAWVKLFSGDYGVGKTFMCSLTREAAWQQGFVVSAVNLWRDVPFHKFEVIYHQILEGMRTDHFRDVPAFEFIIQEWLFTLEKDVQREKGLNPLNPDHLRRFPASSSIRSTSILPKFAFMTPLLRMLCVVITSPPRKATRPLPLRPSAG